MSCADDRYTDEQLELWANWAPEPAGVEPEKPDTVQTIGPHLLRRGEWRPIDNIPDISTYLRENAA